MPAPIDDFMPQADVRERHEPVVRAPTPLVLDSGRTFEVFSVPAVRAIFWLCARFLGAKARATDRPRGLVEEALGMGWGVLTEEKGRFFVAGAACRPWNRGRPLHAHSSQPLRRVLPAGSRQDRLDPGGRGSTARGPDSPRRRAPWARTSGRGRRSGATGGASASGFS
jgi:hypothetical protein